MVVVVKILRDECSLPPQQGQHGSSALSRMTMGSVSHVEESKKDLVKDVHRLASLGVRLKDSSNSGFMVHHKSESYLLFEVIYKQHLDQPLVELK